jgi:hypothetical protein
MDGCKQSEMWTNEKYIIGANLFLQLKDKPMYKGYVYDVLKKTAEVLG